MNYRLITVNPLALAEFPVSGYPLVRSKGDPSRYTAPDGYAYVPELPRPEFDRLTQTLKRALTPESYGWAVVDLPPEEIQEANPVPSEVTRRQLLLQLLSISPPITRDMIRTMLQGNEAALVEFEEAQTFKPDHPLVVNLSSQLGFTQDAKDDMFREAAKL